MSNTIDHERKTILIRWHGLRQYQKTEVVGMRGYPEPNEDGSQRYELDYKDGQWRADYFVADIGHGIGYDPIFRLVKQDADLFAVIRACEEHAYITYMAMQEYVGDDDVW